MPSANRPRKPHRLNLEMTDEVKNRLDRLRDQTQADSQAETIRRALAIYEWLWQKRQSGAEVVLRKPDGSESIVEII
jgi:predicted transcriptional regulator